MPKTKASIKKEAKPIQGRDELNAQPKDRKASGQRERLRRAFREFESLPNEYLGRVLVESYLERQHAQLTELLQDLQLIARPLSKPRRKNRAGSLRRRSV